MSFNNIDTERIKNYITRIFKMWFVWTIIYLPLITLSILHNKKGIIWGVFTKFCAMIFKGNAEIHLWFLHALIIAVFLVFMFMEFRWPFRKLILLAGVLHIISLLGGSYYFVYLCLFPEESGIYLMLHGLEEVIPNITTNGFTVGFLYVAIGALLGLNVKLKKRPMYVIMRKMSMFIYFVHPWFLFLVGITSKRIYHIDALSCFVIATLLTLVTSRVIVCFSNKDKKGILSMLG